MSTESREPLEYILQPKVIKRFHRKYVVRDDGCWEWTIGRFRDGYGQFSIKGISRVASRISWIIHNKRSIPNKMMVCHKCDTPECVNPAHLFIGSARDNARDRSRKGRSASRVGERNNSCVLSRQDVIEIRKTFSRGGVTRVSLSEKYGVNKQTVCNIISGKSWSHLLDSNAVKL